MRHGNSNRSMVTAAAAAARQAGVWLSVLLQKRKGSGAKAVSK